MKNIYALVAEKIIVDSSTNNANIIGVIEEITPSGFPLFFPSMVFHALFEKEDGEPDEIPFKLKAQLEGKQIALTTGSLNFAGKPRTRLIASHIGFPLHQAGGLHFSMWNADETELIAEYTVRIQSPPPPPSPINAKIDS